MATNTLVHAAPGWPDGALLTHVEANGLDAGQAASVRRDSTASAWRNCPLSYAGTSDTAGLEHAVYVINGQTFLRNTAKDANFSLYLPYGHTLTKVRLLLIPPAGHVGQPASLPYIKAWKTGMDGAATLLGSATYTWVDVPTYEGGITLEVAGLAEVIANQTFRYSVQVAPENGANSITGALVQAIATYVAIDSSIGGPDIVIYP